MFPSQEDLFAAGTLSISVLFAKTEHTSHVYPTLKSTSWWRTPEFLLWLTRFFNVMVSSKRSWPTSPVVTLRRISSSSRAGHVGPLGTWGRGHGFLLALRLMFVYTMGPFFPDMLQPSCMLHGLGSSCSYLEQWQGLIILTEYFCIQELTEEGLPFLILFHMKEDTESLEIFQNEVARQLISEKGRQIKMFIFSLSSVPLLPHYTHIHVNIFGLKI